MNLRRFLAEAGTLVGLAVACALVSNALARNERKLPIPGQYPNATKVTARSGTLPLAPFEAEPGAETPVVSGPAPASPPEPAPGATVRPSVPPSRPASPGSNPASSAELLARFPVHGQPYVEITGEAAAWLHARRALFLDARRSDVFSQGHIEGARSFPVWEAEVVKERVEGLVAEGRDPALPVVLYCSGGDCEDSHMLAQALFGAGFENLLVYRDGFPDWLRRGGAVRAGGPA